MTNPPALAIPESLNLEDLAQDIAKELLAPEQILAKHQIQASLLRQLLSNNGFSAQVEEFRKLWLSPEGTDERTRMKAKMAEEDLLGDMHHIVKNPIAAPSDRISAFKAIQQSAGTPKPGKDQGGPNPGGGSVNIQINLNGEKHDLNIQRPVIDSDALDAS